MCTPVPGTTQDNEIPATATSRTSIAPPATPAPSAVPLEQPQLATTDDYFERAQIELCWGPETDVPDHLVMEDCATVDDFFKLINDQVPRELSAKGKVVEEIKAKTLSCTTDLKVRLPYSEDEGG